LAVVLLGIVEASVPAAGCLPPCFFVCDVVLWWRLLVDFIEWWWGMLKLQDLQLWRW
jgi:hypothetical protein